MGQQIKLGSIFAHVIVASQWLQAPLYFGLIVAQGIYVYQFCIELYLLKSFIEIEKLQKTDVYIQMGIHFLFIISAIGLAHVALMTETSVAKNRPHCKPVEAS